MGQTKLTVKKKKEKRGVSYPAPSPSLAKRELEVRLRPLEVDNLMHALRRDTNEARYGAAISNRGTGQCGRQCLHRQQRSGERWGSVTPTSTSGNQVQQSFEGNTGRFGGAVFSSASGYDARDNWWGVATRGMVNANVLTEPFLTDGCPQ